MDVTLNLQTHGKASNETEIGSNLTKRSAHSPTQYRQVFRIEWATLNNMGS